MARNDLAPRVESVRRFNRFYTKQIGLLSEHILKSQFSWPRPGSFTRSVKGYGDRGTPSWLDAGYLSRLLAAFKKRG